MRGPHNILRLIRTGATLERTGAMRLIMDALEAPALVRGTMRCLAWPFQWLGYKGDTHPVLGSRAGPSGLSGTLPQRLYLPLPEGRLGNAQTLT